MKVIYDISASSKDLKSPRTTEMLKSTGSWKCCRGKVAEGVGWFQLLPRLLSLFQALSLLSLGTYWLWDVCDPWQRPFLASSRRGWRWGWYGVNEMEIKQPRLARECNKNTHMEEHTRRRYNPRKHLSPQPLHRWCVRSRQGTASFQTLSYHPIRKEEQLLSLGNQRYDQPRSFGKLAETIYNIS